MGSAITFDAKRHEYRDEAGNLVPSVTQIIRAAGLSDSRWYNEHARMRGTAVHTAIQYLNEGTLDESSVIPEVDAYLRGYRRFLQQTGFVVQAYEQRVFNPIYRYAGTMDLLGTLNGKSTVIDIKTGSVPVWAGLQLAAYGACIPPGVHQRFALNLTEDSLYKLVPFADRNDFNVFAGACAVASWKAAHNVPSEKHEGAET
jgi:hypothetical protein